MSRLRIEVLKRVLHDDLIQKKMPAEVVPLVTLCPEVEEGEIFIAESLDRIPQGFCEAAWTDIVNKIRPQLAGNPPASRELQGNSQAAQPLAEQPFFLSCMDGLRPVTFEVAPLAD
ncbi:hypothetical protein ACFLSF_00135 [Candidatus Bipolaricaulota bacterium]